MPQLGRPRRAVRPREELARAVVLVLGQTRREAGVTRARLAALSGVSSHTIAKIEQAAVTDPGFTVVATLAEHLDLPLEDLMQRARDTLDCSQRSVPMVRASRGKNQGRDHQRASPASPPTRSS